MLRPGPSSVALLEWGSAADARARVLYSPTEVRSVRCNCDVAFHLLAFTVSMKPMWGAAHVRSLTPLALHRRPHPATAADPGVVVFERPATDVALVPAPLHLRLHLHSCRCFLFAFTRCSSGRLIGRVCHGMCKRLLGLV